LVYVPSLSVVLLVESIWRSKMNIEELIDAVSGYVECGKEPYEEHKKARAALVSAFKAVEMERDEWERKSKNNGLAAAIATERMSQLEADLVGSNADAERLMYTLIDYLGKDLEHCPRAKKVIEMHRARIARKEQG
jgi:hypothetical protein